MQDVAAEIPKPISEAPKIPISHLETYQGATDKMDVLNNGLNGREQAVPFQLKEGTQGFSFVLNIDPKDEQRVINLDTKERVSELSDEELSSNAIIQQIDGKLSILRPNGQDVRIGKESLMDKPYVIELNNKTGVEIIDFDPVKNSIVLHKVKLEKSPPPIVPPVTRVTPDWRQRLVDIVGPLIIGGSLVGGHIHDTGIQHVPPPDSSGYTQTVLNGEISNESPKTERDPSLQCESTEEVTMKEGDYLTKILVDKNGWDRYLDANGNINVPKMYEDLACMLSLPENQAVLQKTDPQAAAFIANVFDKKTIDIMGQPTADSIYKGLSALNAKRGGSSDQLVVNKEDDTYQVPIYRKK